MSQRDLSLYSDYESDGDITIKKRSPKVKAEPKSDERFQPKVVIPNSLRNKVLELFHDDPLNGGHLDQHHQRSLYQKHHGLA